MVQSTSIQDNAPMRNQNPPVNAASKHTILRVLDFLDTGRGVPETELKSRSGIDYAEAERGICQLQDAGYLAEVKVSNTGKAKSVWDTSRGFRLTETGRAALAQDPSLFSPGEVTSDPTPAQPVNTCRALMVRPCVALMVIRVKRITEATPDRLSDAPETQASALVGLRFQPVLF